MQEETKQCQNCKNAFTIDATDFAFYDKIKVPPPTWCPECRLLRKMVWRTDINLYRRPDSRDGTPIFSMYGTESPIKVYDISYWLSDRWDPMDYGREYDFSRPFFEQFRELMLDVPFPSKAVDRVVNCDYSNNATNGKDLYLSFGATNAENVQFSSMVYDSKSVSNSIYTHKSENIFDGFYNMRCYNSVGSNNCTDSVDIFFCKDCVGVNNCFGCIGLRNASYRIFNKQVGKEEYKKFVQGANIGSWNAYRADQERARVFWQQFPVKFMSGTKNTDVTGDKLNNCKSVEKSFDVTGGENLKYCHSLGAGIARDSYDYFRFSHNAELIYDTLVCGTNISRLKFCFHCYPECSESEYAVQCGSSSNLFGCVGLRKKQYCILNKQYSKGEYEDLVPKIKQHMQDMPYIDKQGRVYTYGEFFPMEFSPLAYNETVAQEYFSLTKDEALARGFRWVDPEEKDYHPTITTDQLPDNIKDAADSICDEIIACAHGGTCNERCTTAFKVIPQELQFYRQMNLPLPRLCPNCRHYERLKQRNPLKLWHRTCQCSGRKSEARSTKSETFQYTNTATHTHGAEPCPTEFETSYAPERQEIVYCESCYQQEAV
ncbi:MAG: hypothetical protein AAB819_02720 [Patescibacteria group bacterium]